MEHFNDTAIVLKNLKYNERDLIVVCLTQNHGKITAIAKNAINSRRFGGCLDFLACTKFEFAQKPHSEMARIDSAHLHFEFTKLQADFHRFTSASFVAEFCLKLLEERVPTNEMYTLLSNVLFYLNAEVELKETLNAFLVKAIKIMGYAPSLLRCVSCAKGAHEFVQEGFQEASSNAEKAYFWSSRGGGMICKECALKGYPEALKRPLKAETLLLFHRLSTHPFKEIFQEAARPFLEQNSELHLVLVDFLHHHVPGLPVSGFKSWALLSQAL